MMDTIYFISFIISILKFSPIKITIKIIWNIYKLLIALIEYCIKQTKVTWIKSMHSRNYSNKYVEKNKLTHQKISTNGLNTGIVWVKK